MKLASLEYKNLAQGWEFNKIDFFDLTLLVGLSGVGKTQILQSIRTLKNIAGGQSINGIYWDVEFSSIEGNKYHWIGEFEKVENENITLDIFPFIHGLEKEVKYKIIKEEVFLNDELIIKRNERDFLFHGDSMPKLSSTESAISILKEESSVEPAYNAFKKIVYRDHTSKQGIRLGTPKTKEFDSYTDLEKIKESDLDTFTKLYLVSKVSPEIFNEIKQNFVDVFYQVEDVKIETVKSEDRSFSFEAQVLYIKEKDLQEWIPLSRMSSGMIRTLLHISEMFLWSKGTLILIDEFENSLGINCIDVLTEDLLIRNNDLQFIATSHHPYIINKIPYDYWKIVTRKGGKIKTFDAANFNLGDSNHERFLNLVNLKEYKEGVSA